MAGPADMFKNLLGTSASFFGISLAGPQLKAETGGELSIRNNDDSDYAILRAKAPVGDFDVATKFYADSISKPLIVKRQADCSVAIPNNTGVRGWVVVTTAGNGAVIGDILYDDGSGTGQMSIIAAIEGRTIAVTDALSGGTATFEADSIYIWDADGSTWVKIGDIGAVTGAVRAIRYILDNAATQDSTSQIPANNRIIDCKLLITSVYDGGTTIAVGDAAQADKFMGTIQNVPQKTGLYDVEQDTDKGVAGVVRTTITGAPAAGAGAVTVVFTNPNA